MNRNPIARLCACLLFMSAVGLGAQPAPGAFPSKPFRFVVPFPAGSTTDQTARFIAKHFTEATSQPVVVENKAGANGFIGVQHALSLPADGYTVLVATQTTQAVNVHLFKKLPYDPQHDFIPLTTLLSGGLMLVVSPSSPYRNVQDVIAAARKQPGKLTFASGNSASRLAGEMLKQSAKVDLLHVPYKGIPPALTDLMGGQVDILFTDGVSVLPQVKAGKVRALGITTRSRVPGLDDIPTIMEQGLPSFELTSWIAAYAPKGTPPELADKLNALIVAAMKKPEAARMFGEGGWVPTPRPRQDFADFNKTEIDRWGRLFRAAGIEPE